MKAYKCHRCNKRRMMVNIPIIKIQFRMIWGKMNINVICAPICRECKEIITKKISESLYNDGHENSQKAQKK